MKKQPLVSIILPAYNGERYIREAIESVLNQSFDNFELIIVDDGSTDGTKKVIQPYLSNQRVHYIYQKNKGVSKARNNGIRISKGEYIATLDDDDVWCDQKKLEKQVTFLESHPKYVLVGSGVIAIDSDGKELFRYYKLRTDREIRKVMLFKCPFASSSVLFRKSALKKVGPYRENFSFGEDWELWMRLGKIGKLYNFSEYFIKYRVYQENVSIQRPAAQIRTAIIKIIQLHKNDYPNYFKALIYNYGKFSFFGLPFSQILFRKLLSIKRS